MWGKGMILNWWNCILCCLPVIRTRISCWPWGKYSQNLKYYSAYWEGYVQIVDCMKQKYWVLFCTFLLFSYSKKFCYFESIIGFHRRHRLYFVVRIYLCTDLVSWSRVMCSIREKKYDFQSVPCPCSNNEVLYWIEWWEISLLFMTYS